MTNYACRKHNLHCFAAHYLTKASSEISASFLNGRRIYGGCTPPFTIFFDFRLRSLRYEKYFLPVLSKLSQASMIKIFHFSDE